MNLTENAKNQSELLKKYKNFIIKMAGQYEKYLDVLSFDDFFQEGVIGLYNAAKTYKENSSVSLHSYCMWQIKYAMQNTLHKYKAISGFNTYQQYVKNNTLNVVSIENASHISCKNSLNLQDKLNILYDVIEHKFSKRDCIIFYKSFGLKNYDDYKCIDIAAEYNLSGASITHINKKIIKYIKSNSILMESLSDLL